MQSSDYEIWTSKRRDDISARVFSVLPLLRSIPVVLDQWSMLGFHSLASSISSSDNNR